LAKLKIKVKDEKKEIEMKEISQNITRKKDDCGEVISS
jgi:hypothetical protein